MPKVSQTDILTLILRDLDQIIETQKKGSESTVPAPASKAAQAEASILSGTLASLATSIKTLSKISSKDVSNIVSTINSLHAAMKGFKLTKEDTAGFSQMMSAISSLTSTFGNMSEGIWGIMKKYSPIRGRLLGKRIAKFYKNIIKGFEKEKLADYIKQAAAIGGTGKQSSANIVAFSGLITSLFSLDAEKIIKLSKAFKKLKPKAGKRLAEFISPIINVIKSMPPALQIKDGKKKGWRENPNIMAFVGLINALASISVGTITKLWLMSKMLGPESGWMIGAFFRNLLRPFKSLRSVRAAKNFRKVISIFNLSIITLVASLAIITVLLLSKPKQFLQSIGVLTGLVIGMYFLIRFLSKKSIRKSSKQALYTIAGMLMIIGGLALILLITIEIGKKFPIKDIGKGLVILGAIILVSLGIIWLLSSKKFRKQSKEALWGVAAILLMFIGISLVMFIAISIGKSAKNAIEGGAIIVAFSLLGIWLLKRFAKLRKDKIIKGLIGAAGVAAMIAGISAAMLVYGKFMQQVHDVTLEDILASVALTAGMILGMVGLAHLLSPLSMDPLFWAGFAMVETISVMIASVSGAMLLFTTFIEKMSKIKNEDIENVIARITGKPGVITAMKEIISGLDEFGLKAMAKMAVIGNTLKPVFTSLSMFIDIIQKIGKMEILDRYDDNGKPVYRKMTNKEFADAGKTVTDAFMYFLGELSNGLNAIEDAGYVALVMNLLFPPKKQGLFGFVSGGRSGIGDIIPVISQFVDLIIKMSSLMIPIEWNEHGTPVKFRKIENEEFVNAAKAVTDSFMYFLTELSNGLTQISAAPYLAFIISQLFPGPKKVKTGLFKSEMVNQPGVGEVISAISDFMDVIIKMASSLIPDKWDKDGNPIHYRQIQTKEFILAAVTLTTCFTLFLSNLANGLTKSVGPAGLLAIKALSKSGVDKIMQSVGALIMPLMNIASGKLAVGDKIFDVTPEMMLKASKKLIDIMKEYTKISEFFTKDNFIKKIFKGSDPTQSIEIMTQILDFITKLSKEIGTEEYGNSQTRMIQYMNDLSTFMLSADLLKLIKPTVYLESILKFYEKAVQHLENINNYTKPEILDSASKSVDTLKSIVDFLNTSDFSIEKAVYYKHTIKHFSLGLDFLTNSLMKFMPVSKMIRKDILLRVPKEIDKVTLSMKKLDDVLIKNQNKRIEAIQTMSDKFSEVSKSIEELNKSMTYSNKIIREFEGEKESREFSIFGHLANRFNVVDKIKEKAEDTAAAAKAQAEEILKRNQKAPEIDTAALVAAITKGLNDWAESQRIINITFGEDDVKKIVGIMGES